MNRSIRAGLLAVAVSGVVVSTSAFALAQAKETAGEKGAGDKPDGYGYEFDDDPLSAGGFGPNDAQIRVRKKAPRVTLIRPRTSFVPEMLKSVENL